MIKNRIPHYIMQLSDSCVYQEIFKVPCRFPNSTCHSCPWSGNYRIAWASRDNLAFMVDKINNGAVRYHNVEY